MENLIKIDKNIEEFLEESINYNLNKFKDFKENHEASNTYFLNLKYLSDFGLKISEFITENNINIYKQYEILLGIKTPKYSAIDQTGFCYGVIYGPVEKLNSLHFSFGVPYSSLLFGLGHSNEMSYNEILNNFDCINFNINELNTNIKGEINLYDFRKKYLPLPKNNTTSSRKYFKSLNKSNNNNKIIYKHNNKSIYLPFEELIKEKINDCIDVLNLNILNNSISFKLTTVSFRRKYKDYKYYNGTITYDKFTISEINLIDHKSEYTW